MTTSIDAPEAQASPQAPRERPEGIGVVGWLRWGWRQLTSMRTALVLLFLLALGTVPGSFLPQRAAAPEKVDRVLRRPQDARAAGWTDLSLFDVFAAPWFAAIYILLFISLAGCVLPAVLAAPPAHPVPAAGGAAQPRPAAAVGVVRDRRRTRRGARRGPCELLKGRRFRVDDARRHGRGREGLPPARPATWSSTWRCSCCCSRSAPVRPSATGATSLVTEGEGFSNTLTSYDAFKGGRQFDPAGLPPFTVWLDSFKAELRPRGARTAASPPPSTRQIRYQEALEAPSAHVRPAGQPSARRRRRAGLPARPRLLPDGSRCATARGRSPSRARCRSCRWTRRPTPPRASSRSPTPSPTSSASSGCSGPPPCRTPRARSSRRSPAAWNPQVALFAFKGDLGLSNGAPQSVYKLEHRPSSSRS